jgi:hypothetical protein
MGLASRCVSAWRSEGELPTWNRKREGLSKPCRYLKCDGASIDRREDGAATALPDVRQLPFPEDRCDHISPRNGLLKPAN